MTESSSKCTSRENEIKGEAVIFEEACVRVGGEDALRRGVARGAIKVTRQGTAHAT